MRMELKLFTIIAALFCFLPRLAVAQTPPTSPYCNDGPCAYLFWTNTGSGTDAGDGSLWKLDKDLNIIQGSTVSFPHNQSGIGAGFKAVAYSKVSDGAADSTSGTGRILWSKVESNGVVARLCKLTTTDTYTSFCQDINFPSGWTPISYSETSGDGVGFLLWINSSFDMYISKLVWSGTYYSVINYYIPHQTNLYPTGLIKVGRHGFRLLFNNDSASKIHIWTMNEQVVKQGEEIYPKPSEWMAGSPSDHEILFSTSSNTAYIRRYNWEVGSTPVDKSYGPVTNWKPVSLSKISNFGNGYTPTQTALLTTMKQKGCVVSGILGANAPLDFYNVNNSQYQSSYLTLLGNTQCQYLHRALETFDRPPFFSGTPPNDTTYSVDDRIGQINATKPSPSPFKFEMMIGESITYNPNPNYPNGPGIPGNFDFENMCIPETKSGGKCTPTFSSSDYRNYVYYIVYQAAAAGIKSILFGQIYLQDPAWSTSPWAPAIISYLRSLHPGLVFGAQTNSIATNYLKIFDYVDSPTAIAANGSIETGYPCHPLSTNAYYCYGLLWHYKYSDISHNTIVSLDFSSRLDDDIHTFGSLGVGSFTTTRRNRAQVLLDRFNQIQNLNVNAGFSLPVSEPLNIGIGSSVFGYSFGGVSLYVADDSLPGAPMNSSRDECAVTHVLTDQNVSSCQ